MPCTYTGSIEGDRALAASEALTEVTDNLCRVLTLVDAHNHLVSNDEEAEFRVIELPKDIEKFWREHKKIDAKRKKDEAKELKDRALAKLDPNERKALGL